MGNSIQLIEQYIDQLESRRNNAIIVSRTNSNESVRQENAIYATALASVVNDLRNILENTKGEIING